MNPTGQENKKQKQKTRPQLNMELTAQHETPHQLEHEGGTQPINRNLVAGGNCIILTERRALHLHHTNINHGNSNARNKHNNEPATRFFTVIVKTTKIGHMEDFNTARKKCKHDA